MTLWKHVKMMITNSRIRLLFLSFILYIFITHEVSALRVYDRMYTQLEAVNPCILRLNGTHSFGCTSSRSGNVGVVHITYNNTDLQWVLKESKMDAYIVALFSDMFTIDNLRALNNSERVSGVFVMQSSFHSPPKNFSPEDTCPNRYSGLTYPNTCDTEKPWNQYGNMMSMFNWKMPVFFTSDNMTIVRIEECYRKHNLPLETQMERPLCALQLSAHMFAAVDSRTCLRRSNSPYNINPIRYCDPLGDQNIFLPVIPFNKPLNSSKYVIVSARLDSTSFFHNLAAGSLSTATSLVALLMTSHVLTTMARKLNINDIHTNILFVLFNGEAYDYIGSSRVAWDMKNGQFPFKENPIQIEDIELFVELSQLTHSTLWYHHLPQTKTKNSVKNFISRFRQTAAANNFTSPKELEDNMLPPSSLQNFIAREPSLPGLVFASYGKQFINHFYHSLYDNASNPDVNFEYANGTRPAENSLQAFIAKFSVILASTLFEQMIGKSPLSELQPDYHLADELLYCYLVSSNCKFFAETGYNKLALKSSPLDYYVSVFGLQQNRVTTLTVLSMVDLTGTKTNATEPDDCKGDRVWWNAEKRICFETEINVTEARSPAFVVPGYDLASGVYSSWTESSWGQEIEVRMFIKPSAGYEWLVFCIGNSIMLLSLMTVFWIKQHAPELFNYPQLMVATNI